jgi:hypothetical protein
MLDPFMNPKSWNWLASTYHLKGHRQQAELPFEDVPKITPP